MARTGKTPGARPPRNVAMQATPRSSSAPGYVLDFDLFSGTVTDFVFASDQTYNVKGTVYLEGTTVIEGGTVIKFDGAYSPQLIVDSTGVLDMRTEMYSPAIFTAKDDNSAGSIISGSTGNPSGYYATTAIGYWPNYPVEIKHARIRYALQGIYIGNYHGAMTNTIRHTSFQGCDKSIIINTSSGYVRNCLFYASNYAFWSVYTDYHVENATFDHLFNFDANYGGVTYAITNSIFCNAGTLPSGMTGDHNVTNNTASAVFQEAGAGKHYLVESYRGTGTTNINPGLAADLKLRTTFPPAILSNSTISTNLTLGPAIHRDSDLPDPGWHYDPVDWAVSGLTITNATLSILPGTAVGAFPGSTLRGLYVRAGARVQAQGTATQPVRIVHINAVQEQASTNWSTSANLTSVEIDHGTGDFTFTEFFTPTAIWDYRYLEHLVVDPDCEAGCEGSNLTSLKHCRFVNGGVHAYYTPLAVTNCFFDRTLTLCWYSPSGTFLNSTFRGGSFQPYGSSYQGGAYYVTNCYFEVTGISIITNVHADFNAYISSFNNRLSPAGSNDVMLGSLISCLSGPLGRYYQNDSRLINKGNGSAANYGLYHFTAQSNGTVKETNSIVDIGYHYVATDSSGKPLDSDAELLPDYLEDINGNGVKDSGESDIFDPDTDGDAQSDYQEYIAGTNPDNDQLVQWKCLSSWHFFTTNLTSDSGENPAISSNIGITNGFDGNGLLVSGPGTTFYQFGVLREDGQVNAALRRGSVHMRVKPFWFSNDPAHDHGTVTEGGNGPGSWVTLFQTTNIALRIDPNGTNLVLTSLNGAGNTVTNAVATISVFSQDTRSSRSAPGIPSWYDCLATYSPEGCSLQWSGIELPSIWNMATNVGSSGIAVLTNIALSPCRVSIGSALDGSGPINAIIDDVSTYNAVGQIPRNPWTLSAVPMYEPPALNLLWTGATNTIVEVKRRAAGSTTWSTAFSCFGTNLLDTSVSLGQRYEYNLNTRVGFAPRSVDFYGESIMASAHAPAIESRGRVLLLVDKTLTNAIESDISGFITNLVGDGWSVSRYDAPRHIDDYSSTSSFLTNYYNITNLIKPFIVSNWNSFTTNIAYILIVGHVTIPYSGTTADDNHKSAEGRGPHAGAWPMDAFYGDVDGVWTDTVTATNSIFPQNWNYPVDGKFDQDFLPTNSMGIAKLEVPVSRIDFAKLPNFGGATNEAGLVRAYLRKNADYRYGVASFAPACASMDSLTLSPMAAARTAAEMISKVASLQIPINADPFTDTNSFVVTCDAGPGWVDRINDAFDLFYEHTTGDIAAGSTSTNCAFYYMTGSYFGDWNSENAYAGQYNFLRAILCTPHGALGAGWMINSQLWRCEGLAAGFHIGNENKDSINSRVFQQIGNVGGTLRTAEFLGDPTLRYPVLPPVSSLAKSFSGGGSLILTWSAPSGFAPAYNVYRSTNGLNGPFQCLTAEPLITRSFTDAAPPSPALYMVKGLELVTTGSGSFTNISQAAFISN